MGKHCGMALKNNHLKKYPLILETANLKSKISNS